MSRCGSPTVLEHERQQLRVVATQSGQMQRGAVRLLEHAVWIEGTLVAEGTCLVQPQVGHRLQVAGVDDGSIA